MFVVVSKRRKWEDGNSLVRFLFSVVSTRRKWEADASFPFSLSFRLPPRRKDLKRICSLRFLRSFRIENGKKVSLIIFFSLRFTIAEENGMKVSVIRFLCPILRVCVENVITV